MATHNVNANELMKKIDSKFMQERHIEEGATMCRPHYNFVLVSFYTSEQAKEIIKFVNDNYNWHYSGTFGVELLFVRN